MTGSSRLHAHESFDVVVVGGGPAGATAAEDLARQGHSVMLLDKPGRIKPCGGAIPPRAIRDFNIPESQIVARAQTARMVSPSRRVVDMPIEGGSVGMVDRAHFDEWLRERAAGAGAVRRSGAFSHISRDEAGVAHIHYRQAAGRGTKQLMTAKARFVIGADGAKSKVADQEIAGADQKKIVFAYHEIIDSPRGGDPERYHGARAEIYYDGSLSPDFYAWVFPHGDQTSVGVGSAHKGFSLRGAVAELRNRTGLNAQNTVRTEGAPIPLKPLKRWDNGRDIILAGDAAGCVAPSSGEGIYYAMLGGRVAADAVHEALETGRVKALATARKRYMKEHGKVFMILGVMQHFWYRNDKRRERFVNMCDDADVQRLTWQAYMEKKLVRANPAAHLRIMWKDTAHLLGLTPIQR
ncbi:MAG: geranylgeranyl diphosphate reductase [Pseudomonadota bacterium]